MILSMVSTNLRISPTNPARGVTDTETDSTKMSGSDASLSTFKQYLLIGTAYAYPDEDEPSNGRILVISCSNSNGSDNATHTAKDTNPGGMHSRFVRRVTEMQVHGGVYSMCAFYGGTILATINSKTQLCMLVESASSSDIPELKFVGTGHHGHILSTVVRCMGGHGRSLLDTDDVNMSKTPGTKGKSRAQGEKEMIAIVGDLMRSISVIKYYPKHQVLEEVARDYNANWTTAVDMLSDNIYLGAEHWNNLFVVKRNPNAKSEEVRCRLDTVGEFHLGEMCNKFMGGSLVMPSSSGAGSTGESSSVLKNSNGGGQSSSSSPRTRRAVVTVGSQTLYATVDGTLGSIIGLDSSTAAFFSTLERAMARTVRPVGDLSHKEFRAFEADRRAHPSRGFVDGDLVESFLDLDRAIMEAVVSEMNHDGGWEIEEQILPGRSDSVPGIDDDGDMMTSGRSLSVDDVLAMVEEMSMLH
jgi:DNA damage-binding protein 1